MINSKEIINEKMIKDILMSYNMDIFDDIPILYRKKIADNIKSLIVSKGTDEVILKIFQLFGFDNIDVRKFMLVREHMKDTNDKYIFSYNTDGSYKYSEMYDLYFSQIDIMAPNVINEIRKPENRLAYLDVVNKDKYWGGYETAADMKAELIKEDFNFIDTDYININTAYSMSQLMTETTHMFSMILDLKSFLSTLLLVEPLTGQSVSLFYSIIMLTAMISKKIGWNGDIITDPSQIASVYKFNYPISKL